MTDLEIALQSSKHLDEYLEIRKNDEVIKDIKSYGNPDRNLYAAMAMQGMLSDPSNNNFTSAFILKTLGLDIETEYEFPKHFMQFVSKCSVYASDTLIAELKK